MPILVTVGDKIEYKLSGVTSLTKRSYATPILNSLQFSLIKYFK